MCRKGKTLRTRANVGGLLGLLTTGHPLGLYAGGFVGFLVGVVLGVVTAVVGVGVSRVRTGLAMFTACGIAGGVFALFEHHSWVFMVVVLSLPGFAVTMGSLPRQSRRSLVLFAAGTAALVGVLLLDVWVGESSEVRRVERRVASARVDVWAPPMNPGCDIRVERGARVGYRGPAATTRLGQCGTATRPRAALSHNPQVDVSSKPQPGRRGPPPAVSAVASMRRGDTVIEVRSTSVGFQATRTGLPAKWAEHGRHPVAGESHPLPSWRARVGC